MTRLPTTRDQSETWRPRDWRAARNWQKLAGLAAPLVIAIGIALAYLLVDGLRAEVSHAFDVLRHGDAESVRAYITSFGVWAPMISLVLMVMQAVAAPIPGFLLVFANGLAFGVVWGWLLSLAGLTLAATICFWLSRALGRPATERLAGKLGLAATDRWLGRYGAIGIILARLIPGISFDAISYAAGLTGIGFWRFALATAIGSAPQTFIYAYLGQTAPEYASLMLAGTIAGMIVLGLVLLIRGWRRRRSHPAPKASQRESAAGSACRGLVE